MHPEILTTQQQNLLPILKQFTQDFFLVGGTAIALHVGHRRSIDFDLFSFKHFDTVSIKAQFETKWKIQSITVERVNELTFVCADVKFTFFHFSYEFEVKNFFESFIKMPDLLTLASLKAFALGRRAKWKDYADLCFLLELYDVATVSKRSQEIFGTHFSEKLFRQQLCYFEDINYSEPIEFMPGFEKSDDEIKQKLIEFALS